MQILPRSGANRMNCTIRILFIHRGMLGHHKNPDYCDTGIKLLFSDVLGHLERVSLLNSNINDNNTI